MVGRSLKMNSFVLVLLVCNAVALEGEENDGLHGKVDGTRACAFASVRPGGNVGSNRCQLGLTNNSVTVAAGDLSTRR